jgi:phosphocarrier protein
MSTSGDSIMGLLMLGAGIGSDIEVETEGPQAEALMEAIAALVGDKFGEED